VHTYGTLFVQRSVIVLFVTCTGFVQIAVSLIFISVCFCKLLCSFCMGFVRTMQGTVRCAGRGSNPHAFLSCINNQKSSKGFQKSIVFILRLKKPEPFFKNIFIAFVPLSYKLSYFSSHV